MVRRRGGDPRLLAGPRDVLVSITAALDREPSRPDGLDPVLVDWRRATAAAALAFVDEQARAADVIGR